MMQWVIAGAGVFALMLATGGIWIYTRREYVRFTEEVCQSIDRILEGSGTEAFDTEEEALLSKIQMRLKKLEEITAHHAEESKRQKLEVQGVVSDISHQLKTPIANVVMYCDTAMNPRLSETERDNCMAVLKNQVGKLDFLVQALIRMSRLEQNIICLKPCEVPLCALVEAAAEEIRRKAVEKKICLEIETFPEVELLCDEKWSIEALVNVLDNAVKYSGEGRKIRVSSQRMEIYTKIEVEDEGAGIAPEHINDVCKRFYREERVRNTEGLGIGLYLTREILEKQRGYLKIQSHPGVGTRVALYFLNA